MQLSRPVRRLLVATAAVGVAVTGWFAYDYLRVDSCLDAGGSWHYDDGHCDFEVNYEGPRP